MREIREATEKLAIAISEWEAALNLEYIRRKQSMHRAGNLFPAHHALIGMQEDLKQLMGTGFFPKIHAITINSAWGAWRPISKKRINHARPK